MATTSLMTAKDLALLPDDGYQYELLRGELIRISPANYRHSKRAGWILWHFLNYAIEYGGEATTTDGGYRLHTDPDSVLVPDVAYVSPDRIPADDDQDHFAPTAPTVVVEVVSASDRPGYLERKVAEYRSAGVLLVLLAYPKSRTVSVHYADGTVITLHEGDVFDGGNVVPGFRLPIREFFH